MVPSTLLDMHVPHAKELAQSTCWHNMQRCVLISGRLFCVSPGKAPTRQPASHPGGLADWLVDEGLLFVQQFASLFSMRLHRTCSLLFAIRVAKGKSAVSGGGEYRQGRMRRRVGEQKGFMVAGSSSSRFDFYLLPSKLRLTFPNLLFLPPASVVSLPPSIPCDPMTHVIRHVPSCDTSVNEMRRRLAAFSAFLGDGGLRRRSMRRLKECN